MSKPLPIGVLCVIPQTVMLLPAILRECCSKHGLQVATSARSCIRTHSWRELHSIPGASLLRREGRSGPLHSFTDAFLLRRAPPPRLHLQSRGAKTRKSHKQAQEEDWRRRNKTVLTYIAAAGVGMIGISYAAVPLYRLYCQVRDYTSFGMAR